MKSQKFGLSVLVLGVSLLFFVIPGCQAGQKTPEQPQVRALLEQMKADAAVAKEAKESLAQQIAADFKTFGELFKAKDFHCLAKLMGKRGTSLVTTSFEKIPGAASAEYWRSLWKEGAELKFVAVNIYVRSLKDRVPVPYCAVMDEGVTYEEWRKNPPYYDAMAVVTFEYQVGSQGAGKSTGEVEDPTGTMLLLHRGQCPWG